jgi:hypothetical protein
MPLILLKKDSSIFFREREKETIIKFKIREGFIYGLCPIFYPTGIAENSRRFFRDSGEHWNFGT